MPVRSSGNGIVKSAGIRTRLLFEEEGEVGETSQTNIFSLHRMMVTVDVEIIYPIDELE